MTELEMIQRSGWEAAANGGRRAAEPVCPGDAGEGRAFSGGVLRGKRTAVYSGPSDGHPAGRKIAQYIRSGI